MNIEALLNEVYAAVKPLFGQGAVARTIPALTSAAPHRFGLAAATIGNEMYGVGDWNQSFSIQSVSKVFSLALVLAADGEAIWDRVGHQPSSHTGTTPSPSSTTPVACRRTRSSTPAPWSLSTG